jgi:hypothetical protein
MSETIVNWEAIVHKNARTSDHGDAGNVVGVEEGTIALEKEPTAEFVIPKSKFAGFDGSEVVLSIAFKELGQYKRK